MKPDWLKKPWRASAEMQGVEDLVHELGLNTVCREASCPNYCECFSRGTATFMILGSVCTRNCSFCGVTSADIGAATCRPPDSGEPVRVAEAVARLNLSYVVVTSVTRDDLADGGAAHFAATIQAIRRLAPETNVEILIPDFGGSEGALDTVIEARPDVISHNMETVRALYSKVRPQADYNRSLALLRRIAAHSPGIKPKSGLMVGLGETESQVLELMDDLRAAGCEIITIGQYLRPSPENIPVEAYIEPATFDRWAEEAKARGFTHVASAPFVRSSYHAEEAFPKQ